MDGGRVVVADRSGGDRMGAAVRHRHRLAAGAQQILGQDRIGWSGSLAAGAAAGRDRLPVADLVRPQGPGWRVPLRSLWRGFRVPLDRRGACVRRNGISASGSADPARARSDRPPTGRCSGDTRRQSCLGVLYRDAAARFARHRRRPIVVLRPRAWRIWRDDHLCLQHSRRNANDLCRDLHIPANSRRRRRCRSAGRGRHRLVARRARCRRMARPAGQRALSWGMIVLALEVEKQLGALALAVRFQIAGGVTALFGPSGAGKTSLVNMIAGLLKPDRGCIVLDQTTLFDAAKAVNVPPHRRQIGYVFQEGRLFPHLSVRQNLDYGRRMSGRPRDPSEFDRIAALLGIANLLQRRPRMLSGGERQRVAIGRALLMQPRLLLLDEPLASLDAGHKGEILPYLVRLRDEAAIPMVYVSHIAAEVRQIATTVVRLDEGHVAAAGGLELLTDAR